MLGKGSECTVLACVRLSSSEVGWGRSAFPKASWECWLHAQHWSIWGALAEEVLVGMRPSMGG